MQKLSKIFNFEFMYYFKHLKKFIADINNLLNAKLEYKLAIKDHILHHIIIRGKHFAYIRNDKCKLNLVTLNKD